MRLLILIMLSLTVTAPRYPADADEPLYLWHITQPKDLRIMEQPESRKKFWEYQRAGLVVIAISTSFYRHANSKDRRIIEALVDRFGKVHRTVIMVYDKDGARVGGELSLLQFSTDTEHFTCRTWMAARAINILMEDTFVCSASVPPPPNDLLLPRMLIIEAVKMWKYALHRFEKET